ncbi:SusC/RagA family TonB-linked outer membrane protein [Pedobacter sp. KLB.chiD]|uniref:SusC/RagA family TonB-linked outer membrane protein n=1 Tax=Pedobacter sp. KLB.chiD TaxID=3387402 RepID=UPI00399B31D3
MKNLCTAAIFFLCSYVPLSGQQLKTEIKVNYNAGAIPAVEAVKRLLSENKIRQYAYSEEALSNYKVQATKCNNESVKSCLDKLFKGLPFETVIHENTVIIRSKSPKLAAADEGLSPVPASSADTVKLRDKETRIEEVVLNAGYYNVKEKELTGSIAKVTAKDIENQPVSNVLSTIQGRMAGVSITQNSGVPGGGFDIQIRGRNSLRTINNSDINGNVPLYIIDGVPIGGEMTSVYSSVVIPGRSINPLNSINPNDIESIEILKDADATAIYGSRGANGVILITTKKGKSGRARLAFNTSYGLSKVPNRLKMMNTEQYIQMRKQAFANDGISVYPASAYDVNGTWDQNRYTDWRKVLIGNVAVQSNNQLSISGGNETTTFLLSLSHNEQTTAFGNNFKYSTNNITNSVSHKSRDNRFQLNISNLFSIQDNNIVRSDATRQSYILAPNAPALYNDDGSINWAGNTFNNPIAAYNSTYSNNNKQLLMNINGRYELFSQFSIKLNGGINYQTFDEISLQPNTMYNPTSVNGQSSATSRMSQSNQDRFSFIIEPQANWKYETGMHQVDVIAGGTFQRDVNKTGAMTGLGFQSNAFIENIGAAQTKIISDQVQTEYRYAALFGRINYQYKKRYILNVTGRRDGSSRFGPNKKYASFGAVGAAWLMSNEDLFKNYFKWLSFGKLRGSYGIAGSDNIGDYQFYDTYTVSSSVYNGITGLNPSQLYNRDFSWEKTKKLELALELGFFKNRLNITAAWYQNRSSNQLVGYQLPAMTGFSTVNANLAATIDNTGLELDGNARLISSSDLQWEMGFNLSFPKNKLLSFPGLEGSSYANQYVIGQPTSIIKLYQLEGINPQTGQYQFTDFNGDGKISSPTDNQVIENIGVKYFGGWNTSLRYKNWNFSVLLQFVKQRNRNYNSIITTPGSMNNQPVQVLDVWSPQNPDGTYMPYTTGSSSATTLFQSSTAVVSDASFIRLKNVELSYRIPVVSNVFKEVTIYFQGQNLVTWTKYFGIDPEFLGMGFLPPLKTFAFGVTINL